VSAEYPENRVAVTMNAPDPVLEAQLRSVVPPDVLVVSVDPAFHLRPINELGN
jgi:hypothetical protein